jgi:hypothetical protein
MASLEFIYQMKHYKIQPLSLIGPMGSIHISSVSVLRLGLDNARPLRAHR